MKQWTFITHHAAVLALLANQPRITAREIALDAGITERTVRMIIRDLEKDGYIEKVREGRGARYTVNPELPIRHRAQSEKSRGTVSGSFGMEPSLPGPSPQHLILFLKKEPNSGMKNLAVGKAPIALCRSFSDGFPHEKSDGFYA